MRLKTTAATIVVTLVAAVLAAGWLSDVPATGAPVDTSIDTSIARGRYLMLIGGCNDCHTPGYLANAGKVPEERWLVGDSVGFRGPWGTTYPSNLRRLLRSMDEDGWVEHARNLETRPPMPWFNLRGFAEEDLRAMHRYALSLPADDSEVPDFVPPDEEPKTPYIVMVPRKPKA